MPPMPGRPSSGTPPSCRVRRRRAGRPRTGRRAGAAAAAGQAAQPGGGEVLVVPVAGLAQARLAVPSASSGSAEQGVAVLGDEPEQQPVHQPQQRAVEVVEVAARRWSRRSAQLRVAGWERKPVPRMRDRLLDAVAELIEGALARSAASCATAPASRMRGRRRRGPRSGTRGRPGRAGRSRRTARRRRSPPGRTRRRRSRPARWSRAAAAASRRWTGSPTGRRRRG